MKIIHLFFKIPGATVLRIGLSLVFLWFGVQQFLHPEMWVGFIPQWVIDMSPFGSITLVHINGAIEVVFGTALILGFFTRASAFVLAMHMAHITLMVGYDSIGVRDFGLAIAGFAILLNGADRFTIDRQFLLPVAPGEDAIGGSSDDPSAPPKPYKYEPGKFHL